MRIHCRARHRASLRWMQPASASPGRRFAHSSGRPSLPGGLLSRCVSGPQTPDPALPTGDITPQGLAPPRQCKSHRGSRPSILSGCSALVRSRTRARGQEPHFKFHGLAPRVLQGVPTGALGALRTTLERLLQPRELSEGHSRKTRDVEVIKSKPFVSHLGKPWPPKVQSPA